MRDAVSTLLDELASMLKGAVPELNDNRLLDAVKAGAEYGLAMAQDNTALAHEKAQRINQLAQDIADNPLVVEAMERFEE